MIILHAQDLGFKISRFWRLEMIKKTLNCGKLLKLSLSSLYQIIRQMCVRLGLITRQSIYLRELKEDKCTFGILDHNNQQSYKDTNQKLQVLLMKINKTLLRRLAQILVLRYGIPEQATLRLY